MEDAYQSFRSGGNIVRIQAYIHPVSGDHFIIWSDIAHCFPGIARIQRGDIFVPLLRNERLYRIKPHGIKYHAGEVLEVIYSQQSARLLSRSRLSKTSEGASIISPQPPSPSPITDDQDASFALEGSPSNADQNKASNIGTPVATTLHRILKDDSSDRNTIVITTKESAGTDVTQIAKAINMAAITSPNAAAATFTSTTTAAAAAAAAAAVAPPINSEAAVSNGSRELPSELSTTTDLTSAYEDDGADAFVKTALDQYYGSVYEALGDPNSNLQGVFPHTALALKKQAELVKKSGLIKRVPLNDWAVLQELAVEKSVQEFKRLGLPSDESVIVNFAKLHLMKEELSSEHAALLRRETKVHGGDVTFDPTPEEVALQQMIELNEQQLAVLIKQFGQSSQQRKQQQNGISVNGDAEAKEKESNLDQQQRQQRQKQEQQQPQGQSAGNSKKEEKKEEKKAPYARFNDEQFRALKMITNFERVRGEVLGVQSAAAKGNGTADMELEAMGEEVPAGDQQKNLHCLMDVVGRRAKDILGKRYSWLESECPKLFVMLPRYDDIISVPKLTWQDFKMYFLCDCGNIPYKEDMPTICSTTNSTTEPGSCRCLPHGDLNTPGHTMLKDAAAFGPYMMAILEMLQYGATIDGAPMISHVNKVEERRRIMYAMVFLMQHGVESSFQLLARGFSSLEDIKPVAPLSETELLDLCRSRVSIQRPFGYFCSYKTLDGDVRWVCQLHNRSHMPEINEREAPHFSNHSDSTDSGYDPGLGSMVATLKTRERAQTFFGMVEQMVTTPVVTAFLDWDFTEDDGKYLQLWIPRLSASCVKIYVREKEEQEEQDEMAIQAFGYDFYGVIAAAIMNKHIEAFAIERRIPGEYDADEEPYHYKSSLCLDPILTQFTRDGTMGKIQLGVLVTDLDKAASAIRSSLQGFHKLSKLTLQASHWDRVDIEFGVSGAPVLELEGDMDNMTDNMTDNVVDFFNERKHDAISVRTYLSSDTMFLRTHALKDVNIRISFPEDGPRIRELIKSNPRLQKLELSIACKDDPCQVFEYLKALMSNHPSMESFHLRKDWGRNSKSSFVWHGVSDRSKMTLSIISYLEDKIGPLLQRFGSCLLQLFIQNINAADTVILEKVTRSRKKGQLKLATIGLGDLFVISGPALDELAKVVARTPLQVFRVTGTVVLKAVPRVGEFLAKVANKITDVHFYGEQTKAILTELTKRMPETSGMDALQELKLSGPFGATTHDLTWIRSLLNKPKPLKTIELHKVNLSHQGWMTLANEINFMRLRYFRVGPDVPLKSEAMIRFALVVPEHSELENFHLDSKGEPEAQCLRLKKIVMQKLSKKTALVSVGHHY